MKKLLSLLASAALVATASSTVVSCTWGCSANNGKNKEIKALAKVDKTGNVTWTGSISVDEDIKDQTALDKAYGVYDSDGNLRSDAKVTVEAPTTLPLKKGQKANLKITYSIPDYDATKDYKDTINKIGTDNKKGDKVGDIDVKPSGTDPTVNPDYVSADSTLKMGAPKQIPVYQKNADGTYTGYDSDGNTYSVNDHGYLVDTTGTPKGNNGFGQRIAGLDKDGKPLKDTSKDGDGKTIYLDNDGYRIEYGKDSTGKNEWHRVSNDGKEELGPNSGSNAWRINDGKDSKGVNLPDGKKVDPSIAPYESVDKDGNITYLDGNGNPVDINKTTSDGKPNPNYGQPIKGESAKPAEPKFTDGDSDEAKEAKKTYSRKQTSGWSLNGSISTKMGAKAKDGSVVVGEQDGLKDGKAVALNPSDPRSHDWQTIKSGKYAGMQVKIDDNGNVDFQWPVTNKQVDDIISGSGKKNSNPSDSSPLDSDGKINLPIGFTDGKNGTGNKLPGGKEVSVTTPWDADNNGSGSSDKNNNSDKKWWIDSSMMDSALAYDDLDGTSLRVYLSSALYNSMSKSAIWNWKNGVDLATPEISDSAAIQTSWTGLKTDDSDGLHYLELAIKPKMSYIFDKQEDVKLTFNDDSKDGFHIISGASELSGTNSSVSLSLTKIKDDITFVNSEVATDNVNKVTFKVDQNAIASDVDFSKDPKVLITSRPDTNDGKIGQPADIKNSGLLEEKDGFSWNALSKELTLKFKDGVLDKGKYSLDSQFLIKNDAGNHFGPKDVSLVVDKNTASDVEKSTYIDQSNTTFKGYSASWSGFKVGNYIDTKLAPSITVNYAEKSGLMNYAKIMPSDIHWNGSELSFDINEIPDKGNYSVDVSFNIEDKLGNSFGTVAKTLSVSRDDGRSIAWKDTNPNDLTFANKDNVSFSIATNDSKKFDAANIESYKLQYQGTVLKDDDYKTTNEGGTITVTLLKEIPNQKDNKLKFVITAIDKNNNQLNPEVIQIAKNEAMFKYSQVHWENSDPVEFNDTTAVFAISSKDISGEDKMVDVDFSKLKLINEQEDILNPKYYSIKWDGEKLSIVLNHEINKDNYKFKTNFALANGYADSGSVTPTSEITASKDAPLSKSVSMALHQTAFSLDDHAAAVWTVPDKVPDGINLNDTADMKVEVGGPDAYKYKDAFDDVQYDSGSRTLSVKLKDSVEIPGGSSKVPVNILFGFKDFNNPDDNKPYGYTGGGSVVAATGYVTKSEPNPDDKFHEVVWKNTDISIATDSDDAFVATFDLDKDKTGVDVDQNKLVKVEQSVDGKTWTNLSDVKDGTSYVYNDGILKIAFPKDIMQTSELHIEPREFRTTFAIGNGYENSKYAAENNDVFVGTQILNVHKDKSTSYERQIVVDDMADVKNYNEKNSGTWHISHWNSDLDESKIKVNISWNKTSKEIPFDPKLPMKVTPPGSGGSSSDEATVDGTKKNPNTYIQDSLVDNTAKGGKDFSLWFVDGTLWGDDYTVSVQFGLKDYQGEYTDPVKLHFNKTAPNKAETEIESSGSTWKVVDAKEGAEGLGGHLIAEVSFAKMGGCIDPVSSPRVSIWGKGLLPNITEGWGNNNRWYFIGRDVDNSTGNILFKFETWGGGNVESYYRSRSKPLFGGKYKQDYDAKLRVSFATGGFSGDAAYSSDIVFNESTDYKY